MYSLDSCFSPRQWGLGLDLEPGSNCVGLILRLCQPDFFCYRRGLHWQPGPGVAGTDTWVGFLLEANLREIV